MKTLRQELVERVVARMQSIRTANGYQTDAGAHVEQWPAGYGEEELRAAPRLGVCDLPNDATKESMHAESQENRLRVQVRIFTSGAARLDYVRRMIGDVLSAVGADQRWGKLALHTEPGSDGFVVPQESMSVAGAAVEFVIVYRSKLFNPFE